MYSGNLLLQHRSMFAPGVGKVVSTDYESVSVQLQKILTSEEGTITLTAPSGAVTGQELFFTVKFQQILVNPLHQQIAYEYNDTIRLVIPSPLPSNVANWIASNLRIQSGLASAITSTVSTNVITYRVIRPGVRLEIECLTSNVLVKAVTTTASNGVVPNVGDGGAIFYLPGTNTMSPGTKALFGNAGFPNASVVPVFMGVRRGRDKIQNLTDPYLAASWIKEDCCEVVRRGMIHVPLETLAPTSLPTVPNLVMVARFGVSGTNTICGGFQILDSSVAGFAAPAGTVLLSNNRVELVAASSDRKSALIRLI